MHEGQFTGKIVEVILKEIGKYPNAKVKSVKAKVGEIYHLVLDSVQMHFQAMTQGTPLEGVDLQLEEEVLKVFCRQCLRTAPVEDHHLLACSSCHSMDVTPVSGNAIRVEAIEVEE